MRSHKHRVVITGIGLTTPLGASTKQTWEALLDGKSGIVRAHDPELIDYPYNAIGYVTQEQEALDAIFDKKLQSKTDRFIHLALLAGNQALAEAQLDAAYTRDQIGVCLGVGIGGLKSVSQSGELLHARGPRGISPFLIPRSITNMAANWLSMSFDLQGPSIAITSACSSSGDAIGHAFRMIRDGYCQAMVTGGSESSVVPVALVAFGNMRALSAWQGDPKQASKPFDKNRTGFVMAEGAGVIVLERKDIAEKRGVPIYAEVAGYGDTSDAYHITAMHPDGRGAIAAINKALTDAQANIDEVAYVNAHGTGTPMNDVLETNVLKQVFKHHSDPATKDHLLVGSTKSMTGHMIGAAGGAEVGITALALKHGIVPPTINLDTPDPECNLDYITSGTRAITKPYALSNSFGFGGGNAVIVLKKYEK